MPRELKSQHLNIRMSTNDYAKLIFISENEGDTLSNTIRKLIRKKHRRMTEPPQSFTMRLPKAALENG